MWQLDSHILYGFKSKYSDGAVTEGGFERRPSTFSDLHEKVLPKIQPSYTNSVQSRLMLHASQFSLLQYQCRMIFFCESLSTSSLTTVVILLFVYKANFYTCKIVSSVPLGYLHNEFTADGVTNENNPEIEINKCY